MNTLRVRDAAARGLVLRTCTYGHRSLQDGPRWYGRSVLRRTDDIGCAAGVVMCGEHGRGLVLPSCMLFTASASLLHASGFLQPRAHDSLIHAAGCPDGGESRHHPVVRPHPLARLSFARGSGARQAIRHPAVVNSSSSSCLLLPTCTAPHAGCTRSDAAPCSTLDGGLHAALAPIDCSLVRLVANRARRSHLPPHINSPYPRLPPDFGLPALLLVAFSACLTSNLISPFVPGPTRSAAVSPSGCDTPSAFCRSPSMLRPSTSHAL